MINNYKFTGKEQDMTELYYFGARYYDPEVGRFISPDPLQDERWILYKYIDRFMGSNHVDK